MIEIGDSVRVLFVGDKEALEGILIEYDKKCTTSWVTIKQGTRHFGGYVQKLKLLRRKKHEETATRT